MWIFGRQRHLNAELISEFLDGRLSSAQQQRVVSHSETCVSCRQELDNLRATISAIQTLPEMTLPRSFTMAAPPPVIAAVRPSVPFRAPTWVYAGAASVAGLALAVIISADTVGVLDPNYRDIPGDSRQAIESIEPSGSSEADSAVAVPTAQPQIAAAPGSESGQAMRSSESADVDGGTELAMAPTTDEAQPGALAAGATATPEPALGYTEQSDNAGPAGAPGPAGPAGPGGATSAGESEDTQTAESTTAFEGSKESSTKPEITLKAQPVDELSDGEPGSVVVLSRGQERGTPIVWRVLEAVLAGLAALFLAGLWWKLRTPRKATEKSNGS